ncbi:MAG: GNAT family N-acetyltransferase [Gammaproteobacteria bacterium]|nr:MAG: GNAT family N-acetyltransferase [Gammaproteobacteria bacterium]
MKIIKYESSALKFLSSSPEILAPDCSRAVNLWRSIKGVTLNESDSLETVSAFLRRNPVLSFVIKALDGKVIGTILCGENGRAVQIYHLAVARSYQGKDLGTPWLQHALRDYRS